MQSRAKATLRKVHTGAERTPDELKAQAKAATAGKAADVGGHVFGHRFVGNQGDINLIPQEGRFNNSAWKNSKTSGRGWIAEATK